MTQNVETRLTARPFLKWAGGKTKLLHEILPRVPARFGRYHEPFLGGGAVFWALASGGALAGRVSRITDTNEELIRTYQAVQDSVEKVVRRLRSIPVSRSDFERVRAEDPSKMSDVEVAARMIYLNKACFNGLYRVNRRGTFNVPYGLSPEQEGSRLVCDEENLLACARILRENRVEILVRAFEDVLDVVRADDLVYLDPPYLPKEGGKSFTSYTSDGFRLEDHERLRDVVRELKRRGVHVVLSNADEPRVRGLYAERVFHIDYVRAPRSINSKGTGRGDVGEILVT